MFFIFGIIMPILLLILESFMLRQGDYSLSNLTLHYWVGDPIENIMEGQPGIFKNENFINSLINSLKLTFRQRRIRHHLRPDHRLYLREGPRQAARQDC